MIRAERLVAARRGAQFREVSFEAGRGELLALVGPPASGLSLLLEVLATLVAPSSGRLFIGSVDALAHPFDARRFVFHSNGSALTADLSVQEYFRLVRAGRGISSVRGGHEAVLMPAGLHGTARLASLTPAERQLVDLAVAARSGASLLLLDDPFQQLATAGQAAAVELIEHARASGTTVVLTGRSAQALPVRWDRLFTMDAGILAALPASPAVPAGTNPTRLDWGAR